MRGSLLQPTAPDRACRVRTAQRQRQRPRFSPLEVGLCGKGSGLKG